MMTSDTDPAHLERRRSVRDEGRAGLRDAVRQRELEVGGEELLDVRPANVLRFLDLNHTEDLSLIVRLRNKSGRINNVRESTGSGHGASRPCPGRGS